MENNPFPRGAYSHTRPGLSLARLSVLTLVLTRLWLGFCLVFWPAISNGADEADHSILIDNIRQEWVGDLDGMVKDRVIRVLVVYNKTMYFLNGGRQYGISYEQMTEFE